MENTDMNETYFDNMYRACKCDYLNWKPTDPKTVSPIMLDIAREFSGIYTKNDYSNTKDTKEQRQRFTE